LGVGSVWISEGGGAGASSSKNVVAGDKSKEKDADGSGNANIKSRNKSKGKMNKSTPAQEKAKNYCKDRAKQQVTESPIIKTI